MTQTQLREIETLLAVLAGRLRPDASDDLVRFLLYRTQTYVKRSRSEAAAQRRLRTAS